jgi:twitching motility two-component system response regulator PilH
VDRFWGMKQGADAYITKPFEEAELLATVTKLL